MAVEQCVLCGEPIGHGNYCPSCGGLRPPPVDAVDPLIGTVVADRYEIIALVSSGGMGRVYRAVQRMLERDVAIKIIDPRVMAKNHAAELTSRFMTEARAASRLNHPNVVSVFDFGRTSPSEHAPLFLAMELLTGPSLADVLASSDARMPLPRVANILRQTLAALGEAHHLGITHRDVKPGNIVLRRQRGDSDHVSVIDFGVARIQSERGMTERGRLLGTPHYMAPEMITSNAAGPSVDLYAVGIILFEMLTGRVPFDDASPLNICVQHASAPRPDPRTFAPNLPDALADVCSRALAVDVDARYPDAQSLAEAIANASSAPMTHKQVSVFPPRSAPPASVSAPASPRAPRATQATTLPKAPSAAFPPEERPSARLLASALPIVDGERTPLVGREGPVQWARDLVAKPSNVGAIVFWGKTGTGRSRMLEEVTSFARMNGAEVVEHSVDWGPHHEVGYTCLRGLVAKLAGLEPDDRRLVAGHASDNRLVSTGLRELFGSPGTTLADEPGAMCAAVVAALAWAAKKAAKRAGRLLLLVVDNVDLVDGVSRACVWRFLQGEPLPDVVMLLASEERPPSAPNGGIHERELLGLARGDAASLVNPLRAGDRDGASGASAPPASRSSARRVEPLYLEQYRRWRAEHPHERAPTGLREIVEARLQELEPAPRRVLQAVAVGGPITAAEVAALLERGDGVGEATKALESAGFVVGGSGRIRVVHGLYARVALDNAPAGVIDHLHARAAEVLATSATDMERRAFHLLRARPDFQAFVLVEKTVRLRALRGDAEGAISALSDGYFVSRTCAARGDADANGWHVFGRKLATALNRAGRADQAKGLLLEVLQTLGPTDYARAPVLEELAAIALSTGKQAEAERWRQEATTLSEPPRMSASRAPRFAPNGDSRRPPAARKSGHFPAKESKSRISVSRIPADGRAEVDDGGAPANASKTTKGRKR